MNIKTIVEIAKAVIMAISLAKSIRDEFDKKKEDD